MRLPAGGHREAGGALLIEALVALLCTGLVAAGVLSLMVSGARTFRSRQDLFDAEASLRGALLAIERDLRLAGAGLEGTRTIRCDGETIPIVSLGDGSLGNGILRLVLPTGTSREVEAEPGGWLRLDDVSGWTTGDLVVALGAGLETGDGPAESLPCGVLAEIERSRPGGRLRVAWPASEAQGLEGEGRPRALLPIAVRQFGTRTAAFGLELRRRDRGSRWQPVVDGLDALRIRQIEPGDSGQTPPAGALVEIEAVALPTGERTISARRWVRVR